MQTSEISVQRSREYWYGQDGMVLGAYVASASMKVSQTLSARMVAQSLRSHIDRSRGQSNLRNTTAIEQASLAQANPPAAATHLSAASSLQTQPTETVSDGQEPRKGRRKLVSHRCCAISVEPGLWACSLSLSAPAAAAASPPPGSVSSSSSEGGHESVYLSIKNWSAATTLSSAVFDRY